MHLFLWIMLSFLLLFVTCVSSSSTVAFWDQQTIDVREGDDVTVTCTVTGLELLDVVRLVHRHDSESLAIADNDDLKPSFARLGRYRVLYHVINGTATLVLQFHGIRGEDSGQIVCHRLMDDVNVAYVNIVVRVPIEDVRILSVTSYDEETPVDDGGDVMLQQHDQLGVACVTSLRGTSVAPAVSVSVAGRDVTDLFERTVDQQPVMLESGLTLYLVTVRLTFVTSDPDPQLNGKTLTCRAHAHAGFDDVTRSAEIVVQFSPIIDCSTYHQQASLAETAVLTCTVRANPGIRVMWSTTAADIHDIHREPTISITNKVLGPDVSQVSLTIKRVLDVHYGNYTLRTDNFIGSNIATIQLTRRRKQSASTTVIRELGNQQPEVNVVVAERRAPTTPSSAESLLNAVRTLATAVCACVATSVLLLRLRSL